MTEQRTDRSPAELRAGLADTVDELAARADVPAWARQKKDETVERVQEQVGRAREIVATKAPVLEDPKVLAGIAAALLTLVVLRRRRRS